MNSIKEKINQMNYYINEIQQLYHKASLKLGLSDSKSIVLYSIYVSKENYCLLSDVYKNSGISKQTINSAIRSLEDENILYLENVNHKSKKIVLTKYGMDYVEKTIKHLSDAEFEAFNGWKEKELDSYIELMKKNYDCLKAEFDKMGEIE